MSPSLDALLTPAQAMSHAAYFFWPAVACTAVFILCGTPRTRRVSWAFLFALVLVNLPRVWWNQGGSAGAPYIGHEADAGGLLLGGIWPPAALGFATQAANAGLLAVFAVSCRRRAPRIVLLLTAVMISLAAVWAGGLVAVLGLPCGAVVGRGVQYGMGRRLPFGAAEGSEGILRPHTHGPVIILLTWVLGNTWQNYFDMYGLIGSQGYYWDYGRQLDFGYFSKPPFIAYANRLVTWFSADTMWAIRTASMLESTLVMAVVYQVSRSLVRDPRWAMAPMVALVAMPYFFSGVAACHDANNVMATCAVVAMFFYYRAWERGGLYWLGAGVALGCCILTKYTGYLFLGVCLLHGIVYARRRFFHAGPVWMTVLALLINVPNVLWLMANEWVTTRHTASLNEVAESRPGAFFVSWLVELLPPLSPLLAVLLVVTALVAGIVNRRKARAMIPWFFWCGLFALYGSVALNRPTMPHWTLPAFLFAVIYLAPLMEGVGRRRTMVILFLVTLLPGLALGLLSRSTTLLDLALDQQEDGRITLLGMEGIEVDFFPYDFKVGLVMCDWVGHVLEDDPDLFLLGAHAQTTALCALHVPGQPRAYRVPTGTIDTQYELWPGLAAQEGKDALVIVRGDDALGEATIRRLLERGQFQDAAFVRDIAVEHLGVVAEGYVVYRCTGYHHLPFEQDLSEFVGGHFS